MTSAFSYPYMYWVGIDTAPDVDAADLAAFNDFYSNVHAPEVLANNPGFRRAARYELAQPDPRYDIAPRFLAMYEMDDEAAARGYAARNDQPGGPGIAYTAGPSAWSDPRRATRWRMIWQQVASYGESTVPPVSIFMVGIDVPADTTPAQLAEFNDFYTNIHVPEVVANGGYSRGIRYQLYREFAHPAPGSPQFCAIYEADATATEAARERAANPVNRPTNSRLSSGPPTWEAHETLWRLVYRRLD